MKIACRLGILYLPRQICYHVPTQAHVMPGNELLPEHQGMVITRDLQEMACLWSLEMPFETVQRLLGWETHCEKILCATEVRRLVQVHGRIIRQTEATEVTQLAKDADLPGLQARWVVQNPTPHPAAWPEELQAAVKQALSETHPLPPPGIGPNDWERVLTARREEIQDLQQLRRLGPEIQTGQIIAAIDDVEVRHPERRRFLAIRTAKVTVAQGYRYLSGTAEQVLLQVLLLLRLCRGQQERITLLGDGARWLGNFFIEQVGPLAGFDRQELLIDWYHLFKKCSEFTSMICTGRPAKRALLRNLMACLWRGQVTEALGHLEATRSTCRNAEKLTELISYFQNRAPYLVNYKERRAHREYIGSGQVEKANDLIVARRQKHQGMHWNSASAEGLAALKTLQLNRGWTLYWESHQVLSFAIPA